MMYYTKRFFLFLIGMQILWGGLYLMAKGKEGAAETMLVFDGIFCFILFLLYCKVRWWFKRCPYCGKRKVEVQEEDRDNGVHLGGVYGDEKSYTVCECSGCGSKFNKIVNLRTFEVEYYKMNQ